MGGTTSSPSKGSSAGGGAGRGAGTASICLCALHHRPRPPPAGPHSLPSCRSHRCPAVEGDDLGREAPLPGAAHHQLTSVLPRGHSGSRPGDRGTRCRAGPPPRRRAPAPAGTTRGPGRPPGLLRDPAGRGAARSRAGIPRLLPTVSRRIRSEAWESTAPGSDVATGPLRPGGRPCPASLRSHAAPVVGGYESGSSGAETSGPTTAPTAPGSSSIGR